MEKNKLKTQFIDAKFSLGFLIWKTSNKLQRLHRLALKELDLTPTQFSVLASVVHISSMQKNLTQSLLCKHTEMDKMLTSDVIKSLVVKKLIKKKKNEHDSRSFLIQPTPLGVKKANEAIEIVENVDLEFFKSVSNKDLFGNELNQILTYKNPAESQQQPIRKLTD